MSRNIKVPTNDAGITVEIVNESSIVVSSYKSMYEFEYTVENMRNVLQAADGAYDSWDFHSNLWSCSLVDTDRL